MGEPGSEAGGGSDSGLGGGVVAGIAIAVLLLLCAVAVAVFVLVRKKTRDSRKDKLGASSAVQPQPPVLPQLLAASRGPPASPRAEMAALGSPPGSPAITSTSSALPISDWKAVALDGMSTATATRLAHQTVASTVPGATTYATTYQYQGSTYDGAVDSTGTFIPMHRAMTADLTEIEHLPADRVVVTQVSGDGDVEGGGFSVRTRTEWTRVGGSITVFPPGMPPDATPGEVLKAQLDWLLTKRGGLLLGYLKCALATSLTLSCCARACRAAHCAVSDGELLFTALRVRVRRATVAAHVTEAVLVQAGAVLGAEDRRPGRSRVCAAQRVCRKAVCSQVHLLCQGV